MTTCIGWHDPDGCPHYGGDYHGCRHEEHHRPTVHVCRCGARRRGHGNKAGRPSTHADNGNHGTDAGYKRHMRDGTPTCAECRAAHTQAEIDRLERRKKAA